MSIQKLKNDIKKGDIAPLYVLYGSQRFLMDDILSLLSKHVLDEESVDFNYEIFDLHETPIQVAVEAAETFPFIGEKRLVVATDASFLTARKAPAHVEHDVKILENYAQNPVSHSVFVLTVPDDKLDERKKVVKLLKKHATLFASSVQKGENLDGWIREQVAQYGVQIDSDSVGLLLQFAGDNMQMLASELQKMAHYVGPDGSITVQVVRDLVAKTIEQDVFTLVDHVVHLRMDKAFETLHELLKSKEEPIKILFLLARQFRLIFRAQDLAKKGYSNKEMSQAMGAHPYACQLATKQSKRFTQAQLAGLLDHLAELDFQMKTGKLEKVLALELFLLRLGQGRA